MSETLAETMLLVRGAKRTRLRIRVVALVVAVAVALGVIGAVAAPARADDRDLARALAAIAVIGIVAGAAKAKDKPRDEYRDFPPYETRHDRGRDWGHDGRRDWHDDRRAPRVPAVCAIEINGSRTRATVYGERCLREVGFDWRLPRECSRPARIYGRDDRIYTEQCLRNAGFRIGGSRN